MFINLIIGTELVVLSQWRTFAIIITILFSITVIIIFGLILKILHMKYRRGSIPQSGMSFKIIINIITSDESQ